MKGDGVEILNVDAERALVIKQQYEDDLKKLQKIRQLSARRAREMVVLQRKIDDVPSRAELSQYQKRFIELYDQVAAKHRETKQHYILYNTLLDVKLFMDKEHSLLNSIKDNFEVAMTTSQGNKDQYLNQLGGIQKGVQTNLDRVEDKGAAEKKNCDKLSETYLSLVELERSYNKAVKDFEAESNKNEMLLQKQKKGS